MSAHGDVDLGHTLAGWAGTALAVTGLGVLGVSVVAASLPLLLLGTGLGLLAGVTAWVLHLAGWGKPSGPRPRQEWPWRVRDLGARRGHPDCLGCRTAGRRPATAAVGTPVTAGRMTAVDRTASTVPGPTRQDRGNSPVPGWN
ncbi:MULTISPECIES: HGxxPAAW family protein [unclassified Streptomyces]|uniref:HGxxPAAW family protein n=1 Tax=unclassified Streptomyces TaxID=2593676 RepID=UPI0033B0CD27